MINIENYIAKLIPSLQQCFGGRLLYVGLQGSYLRGEATNSSDMDIMVVLDRLSVSDLDAYRDVIHSLEHEDKSCGFICSGEDLSNWNPLEICHLIHSTKDYFGVLRDLVPVYTEQDIRNFVKMSINNMYHEICHRYIHGDAEQNRTLLPYTYKGVFFILQNSHYLRCGEFIGTKRELLSKLEGRDRTVLERSLEFSAGIEQDFQESFEILFHWCQETLQSL